MLDEDVTEICSQCQTPVRTRNLVAHISFPDDVTHIVALIETRLNIVTCPVCGSDVPMLIPLVIQRRATGQILAVAPEELMPQVKKAFANSHKNATYDRADNYVELQEKLLPWIDEAIVPGLEAVSNKTIFTKPLNERVSLITPLLLALLQSQVDEKLPFQVFRVSGPDPARARELVALLLTVMIHDHAHNLVLHASETGSQEAILSTIKNNIPASTLSPALLQHSVAKCVEDPIQVLTSKDRDQVAPAYRYELINAILHYHAGQPNPRSKIWAMVLRTLWSWSKHPKSQIDPSFFQTPEIIRAITRFEDLWDFSFLGIQTSDLAQTKTAFEDAAQMMDKFGFTKEFQTAMASGPFSVKFDRDKVLAQEDKLVKSFRDRALKSREFNRSIAESIGIGQTIGLMMTQRPAELPSSVSESLILMVLEEALEAEDGFAAVSLVAYAMESLNNSQSWDLIFGLIRATDTLLENSDLTKAIEKEAPALFVRYFNELGNFYRYTRQYSKALDAYGQAEHYLVADKSEDNQSDYATLLSNKAIVFRSLGRYRQALSLFDQAISTRPDFFGAHHSKAVLLLEVRDLDEALFEIENAIAVAKASQSYGMALITRAQIKNARGDKETALDDLQIAFESFPTELRQLTVAAVALDMSSDNPKYQDFLNVCESKLKEAVPKMMDESHLGFVAQTVYVLLNKRLRESDPAKADTEFGPYLVELERLSNEEEAELDWRLSYLRARLEYACERYKNVWPFLAEALEKSNRDVPKGDDRSFSVSWLTDKEEFQTELATLALDLHNRNLIPASELLGVYEFCNGREISARLQAVDALDIAPSALLEALSKIAKSKGAMVHLIFLIESAKEVVVGHYAAGAEEPTLFSDLRIEAAKLHNLRDRMREAVKFANPADLKDLDQIWSEWNMLWGGIGQRLDSLIEVGDHICILPGRTCTGLPLHLIPFANGRTLFENCSVNYSPNLATLLDVRVRKGTSNKGLVVSVSKESDSESFRNNLSQAVATLSKALRELKETQILKEQEASVETVRTALVDADEVVFLTHGSYGGPRRGFGICVSDGTYLPPGLLPVDEAPELERFLLTWDDVEELPMTPALVVSIACSTGQTLVSRGGVRFGLEQSLFASGTRVILSPLWDIDQTAGLAFVKAFYDLKLAGTSSLNLAKTFQKSCFNLEADFPHPYFWGAFFFNGSLTEALT